jgi:hypothetical protein
MLITPSSRSSWLGSRPFLPHESRAIATPRTARNGNNDEARTAGTPRTVRTVNIQNNGNGGNGTPQRSPTGSPTRNGGFWGASSSPNRASTAPGPLNLNHSQQQQQQIIHASPSPSNGSERMKMYLRWRPLLSDHQADSQSSELLPVIVNRFENQTRITIADQKGSEPKSIMCDAGFGPESTQEEIFKEIGAPAIENLLNGYNGTIMAYGQTVSSRKKRAINRK